MKIENDHPAQVMKTTAPSAKSMDVHTFRAVFDKSLQEATDHSKASDSLSVTRAPAATPMSIGPLSSEQAAVKHFEDLLCALTTYQERLGNGRISLKLLEQDLKRIDDQCRQLDLLAQNLSSGGDLLPVLREGLTTVRMEMERFHRGDYC